MGAAAHPLGGLGSVMNLDVGMRQNSTRNLVLPTSRSQCLLIMPENLYDMNTLRAT